MPATILKTYDLPTERKHYWWILWKRILLTTTLFTASSTATTTTSLPLPHYSLPLFCYFFSVVSNDKAALVQKSFTLF